jgi:tripartite-type tricarboxylate transporter receptor subunit TctC
MGFGMGRVLIAAMVAAGLSAAARAQDYPSRPVTMVVPFTSGGSTEIMARLIAQGLEVKLGKPVIVENKPGAGTVIGSNFVAKSEPDGYTLLMGTSSPIAINVTVYKALPYNPATDFVPLAMVAESPFVLVVNNDLPVKTIPELIAYAKANPGKLSFGSGGPGAPHHLFAELFASMAGIKMTHVPYRGSLPALNDVLAGHIQLMFCDLPPAVGMISSGKIRALGVTPAKRLAALPDVPTIAEAGVPGYSAAAWFMVVAPSKTPKPVVDRLHADMKEVLTSAQTRGQIDKLGLTPLDTPPIATMQDFVKSEIARWGKVVEAAGIAGSQ